MSTKLADNFETVITRLIADAGAAAAAGRTPGATDARRRWMLMGFAQALQELEEIHGHFDRAEAAVNYKNVWSDDQSEDRDNRALIAVANKLQSDVLSSLERDFRSRHGSPLRTRMHATAARVVAGDADGVVGNIKRYAALLFAQADAKKIEDDGIPDSVKND